MRQLRFGSTVLAALSTAALAFSAEAVDGVIEINQTAALEGNVTPGDLPGFPVSINQSGSYRLTSNLEVTDVDTTAIESDGDYVVSIDLNGFAIIGPVFCPGAVPQCDDSGSGYGIRTSGTTALTVRNGAVQGAGAQCIATAGRALVEDVLISHCANGGVLAGPLSIVRGNRISNLQEFGIKITFQGGLAVGNTVFRATGFGISMANFVPVLNSSGYGGNVLELNNGGPGQPQVEGGVQIGTNICDGDTICP